MGTFKTITKSVTLFVLLSSMLATLLGLSSCKKDSLASSCGLTRMYAETAPVPELAGTVIDTIDVMANNQSFTVLFGHANSQNNGYHDTILATYNAQGYLAVKRYTNVFDTINYYSTVTVDSFLYNGTAMQFTDIVHVKGYKIYMHYDYWRKYVYTYNNGQITRCDNYDYYADTILSYSLYKNYINGNCTLKEDYNYQPSSHSWQMWRAITFQYDDQRLAPYITSPYFSVNTQYHTERLATDITHRFPAAAQQNNLTHLSVVCYDSTGTAYVDTTSSPYYGYSCTYNYQFSSNGYPTNLSEPFANQNYNTLTWVYGCQ